MGKRIARYDAAWHPDKHRGVIFLEFGDGGKARLDASDGVQNSGPRPRRAGPGALAPRRLFLLFGLSATYLVAVTGVSGTTATPWVRRCPGRQPARA
jgi:hypothetical protein